MGMSTKAAVISSEATVTSIKFVDRNSVLQSIFVQILRYIISAEIIQGRKLFKGGNYLSSELGARQAQREVVKYFFLILPTGLEVLLEDMF